MGLIPLCLLALLSVSSVEELQAQPSQVQPGETSPAADERSLQEIQQSISARYQRFSKTLIQLHGYMKESDPARAELLMRVIGRSNEARIDSQFEMILELLSQETPQFGGVVERQESLITSMLNLLDVLQSEDEHKRIQDEITRIEALIKDLNNLIVEQKEVRAGTERGRPEEGLQQNQQQLTDKTKGLADQIDDQDRERSQENSQDGPADKDSQNKTPEQKQPDDQTDPKKPPGESEKEDSSEQNSESTPQPAESENQNDKKSDSKSPAQDASGQPMPSSESPESPSESGSSEDSEKSDSNSDQPQTPQQQKPAEKTAGREELESAIEKMQRAIEELKEKNRDQASREQDRAIAELEKAKARLEEILRQFREEEQKIVLAALEVRFRKMLTMQVSVRKSSGQLQEIPEDKRLPRHRARSTQLARDEQEIVVEADKALILLREEGTSVAFPEAVTQLRDDMQTVAERLNTFQMDELTLAIQDDVIEALSEMLEALRQEMEKLEQKQQQQQQQQGEPGDQELIDLIAELKLLRSLQYRVNRRTTQLGREVDGEQATETEILELLNELGQRQARIQRATYDLSTGRNR